MMMLCPPATALLAALELSSPSPSPPPSSPELLFSLPRLPDFFPLRKRHPSCSRHSDLSTRLAAIQYLDTLAAPSEESIIHHVDPSLSPPTLLSRFATHAPASTPHGDEFIRSPQLVVNQEIEGVHRLLTDTGVGSFKTSLQHAEDAEGFHDFQTTETISESSDRAEDDSIVQNEKLRRMRISEANRLQVPWNKGRSYKQERKLSSEIAKKDIGLNTSNLDDEACLLKKEKLRRQRIATANKGKVPWNKGRQHSEETRKRIRERTMEAMKNPEIREKLRIHGSTLSSETRSKISSALALLWDTRKKKKKAQETLIEEWREMIADTARKGYGDELAYEWNSYNIILKEMQHAWSLNRKKRKKKETSAGLSADHRIKISNAIKSKWANIEYRNTVTAGIHARWAKQGRDVTRRSRRNLRKKEITIESENKRVHVTLQKKNADDVSESVIYKPIPVKKLPTYKNPSSIEMVKKLKHIREIRALEDVKRREATERARILMAEAQRATRALEAAAAIDESALGPLKEAQKLLAEAAESFKNAGLEMEDALNCE